MGPMGSIGPMLNTTGLINIPRSPVQTVVVPRTVMQTIVSINFNVHVQMCIYHIFTYHMIRIGYIRLCVYANTGTHMYIK